MEGSMQAEAARAIATLIIALVVAYVGLRIYFRQKEYELVKQRYLEQALDIICGDLAALSNAFGHNWSRCLQVVRAYRDVPQTMDPSEVFIGFVPLGSSNFNAVAHNRLRVLIGSDVFWSLYQLALARYASLNNMVTDEIPRAVQALLNGKIEAKGSEVVDFAQKELKPMMSKSEHFATLAHALHQLSAILERERLSFKMLKKFAERKDVKEIVAGVTKHYAAELSDDAL
jgi:hypothetical protein